MLSWSTQESKIGQNGSLRKKMGLQWLTVKDKKDRSTLLAHRTDVYSTDTGVRIQSKSVYLLEFRNYPYFFGLTCIGISINLKDIQSTHLEVFHSFFFFTIMTYLCLWMEPIHLIWCMRPFLDSCLWSSAEYQPLCLINHKERKYLNKSKTLFYVRMLLNFIKIDSYVQRN